MLDIIPQELFTIVRKHLSYKDLQNINNMIIIDTSDKEMFVNSKLFYQNDMYLESTLHLFEITSEKLYNMLKNSALDINNVYDILFAIITNDISNENKYDYNLKINYNKIEYSCINNTITVLKILMMIMEHHVTDEFIINNPYHYTSINITNTLLRYFHYIVHNNYTIVKDIERNSFRFNLMMFECPWYKSNINIYNVFLLYLLNINVISSDNIQDIYNICSYRKKRSNILKSNKKDEFVLSILNMFQDAKHIMKLTELME